MERVLYCASVSSHLRNFHLPHIKKLAESGHRVDTLTADGLPLPYVVFAHKACFTKQLWSPKNIYAILQVRRLVADYNLIITNTTLAGAVVRAAILLLTRSKRPAVIHICHGFLFQKNDSFRKHMYLLVERLCARTTDRFVVMNHESEVLAHQYKLGKQIIFTHGMGIDLSRFQCEPQEHKGFRFVYVADFSKRKNQAALIQAFAKIVQKLPDAFLVFAGKGATLQACKQMAESIGITHRVEFLGHVDDIPSLLCSCDCAVSTSKNEGLPFNILEAMAAGLPILASDIAGHRDLLQTGLFSGQSTLEQGLVCEYKKGKRRVSYLNLNRYSLEGVKDEWQELLKIG